MFIYFLAICLLLSFISFVYKLVFAATSNISGCHVLITGGSSGIGKAIAIDAVCRGANVTLVARDKTRLEGALGELERYIVNKNDQKIRMFSVDISKEYAEIEKMINQAEAELGPILILINCAGYAVSGRFEETPLEEFQNLLDVNYLGSVFVTRAVLPTMKAQRCGRIMFTSSQAGLLGVYGYTAYSASKFALRGLAEALQMEVKPYNISITLGFPPDTDTPGFAQEEKTKPIETKLISQTSGLVTAQEVAKSLLDDTLQGKFMSSIGFEGSMLSTVCAGMSPMTSISDLITQMMAMGVFRFIAVGILYNFNKIVEKCMKERDTTKKDS